MEKADAAGNVVASGVAFRHGQSFGRDIGGNKLGMRQFGGECDGDAAGAGADIRDEEAGAAAFVGAAGSEFAQGKAIERDFDKVLRLRARDKHIGRDLELEAPKFLFAGEVLNGFAGGPPLDEMQEAMGLAFEKRLLGVGVKPGAVTLEDVEQEQFGGERMRRDVSGAEASDSLLERGTDVHKKV